MFCDTMSPFHLKYRSTNLDFQLIYTFHRYRVRFVFKSPEIAYFLRFTLMVNAVRKLQAFTGKITVFKSMF